MQGAFCTIVTPDTLGAALALNESVSRFTAVDHFVFVACGTGRGAELCHRCPPGLHLVFIDDLCAARAQGAGLYDAYGMGGDKETFCRAMKPVLMTYVLDRAERVIYLDAGLCFFDSPVFLFEELRACDVLLFPRWRCWEPDVDAAGFEAMYSEGFFNGGLVGASRGGRAALEWWAEACLYNCDRNKAAGRYGDQRYLDLLALEFGGVRVLRHKGCGVAAWNRWACPASRDAGGGVLIDGRWPLVCAHFDREPEEDALRPCFEEYRRLLERHAPEQPVSLQAASDSPL